MLRRLRALSEAECYCRCYDRRDDNVRIVAVEPRRGRSLARLSGEQIRRLFEERLDAREADVEAAA